MIVRVQRYSSQAAVPATRFFLRIMLIYIVLKAM